MIKNEGKLGIANAWLSPFEPRVLGGLRGKINQFSDGSGTTLTPKYGPKKKTTEYSYISLEP